MSSDRTFEENFVVDSAPAAATAPPIEMATASEPA